MRPPPQELDGARVLAVADLAGAEPTGGTRHIVGGGLVQAFAALAICRYDDGVGCYLFYCDEDWRVVTDTLHDDVAAAAAQARSEFGDLAFTNTT